MKKEDLGILAQLLAAMSDAVDKLEKAEKNKDPEKVSKAKREIARLQDQIKKIL